MFTSVHVCLAALSARLRLGRTSTLDKACKGLISTTTRISIRQPLWRLRIQHTYRQARHPASDLWFLTNAASCGAATTGISTELSHLVLCSQLSHTAQPHDGWCLPVKQSLPVQFRCCSGCKCWLAASATNDGEKHAEDNIIIAALRAATKYTAPQPHGADTSLRQMACPVLGCSSKLLAHVCGSNKNNTALQLLSSASWPIQWRKQTMPNLYICQSCLHGNKCIHPARPAGSYTP